MLIATIEEEIAAGTLAPCCWNLGERTRIQFRECGP
jgi:hypothetical protein